MTAPIVYRWDDSGAPVARGERASLCDILYACLVTGYGSKAAAGWTREYVNGTNDKAVFRNNPVTGTGFYLQVDGYGGANAYTPYLQGFEVMTSVDDGLFPFNATRHQITTSNAANTTARPWVLIADDRAFYFFCWVTLTTAPTNASDFVGSMFFGDLVGWVGGDNYFCGLCASSTVSRGSFGTMIVAAGTTAGSFPYQPSIPRKSSGAVGTSYIAPLLWGGGPTNYTYPGQAGAAMAYTSGDPVLLGRPTINNGEAYSFRGYLPGYYYSCQTSPRTQLEQVTIAEQDFIAIASPTNGVSTISFLFFLLDDWRS